MGLRSLQLPSMPPLVARAWRAARCTPAFAYPDERERSEHPERNDLYAAVVETAKCADGRLRPRTHSAKA